VGTALTRHTDRNPAISWKGEWWDRIAVSLPFPAVRISKEFYRDTCLHSIAWFFVSLATIAEDAVQDALLSAFTHISQFEGRSHISTWLHRIVINSARMRLRRWHGRTFVSLDETGEGANSDLEHQLIDAANLRKSGATCNRPAITEVSFA
jgi:hypothetical protein